MKFLPLCLIVLVVLFNVILAAPGVTAASKPCNECPLNYAPICAGPPGTTNDKDKKSFGNECVMEKYNCEKNEKLVKLSGGECPGSKSVRLQ